MFERIKLNSFEDYFVPYTGRSKRGVYFCRLTRYSDEIHQMICRFIETTYKSGVCISGKIGNPDGKQIDYYEEMMGRDFQLNPHFFAASLKRWLPRIKEKQRKVIANAFYDILIEMAKNKKNENMQKNAYIKFMCWLYYKFEPILQQLGNPNLPKILFEGYLNDYELKMMRVLSKTGCDILLLEYRGDEEYLQIDKESEHSQLIPLPGSAFPADYSILTLREQLFKKAAEPELKYFKPEKVVNTNTWIKGDPFSDSLRTQLQRGNDRQYHYNLFSGIYGAEDTGTYYSELLKWKLKMESLGKHLLLIEETLPRPTFEEINVVGRKKYQSTNQMLNEMVLQIRCPDRTFLTYCQHAFMQIMKELSNLTMQKLMNIAVMLICWMNRYAPQLSSQKDKEPVFVFYGNGKGSNEILLFRLLAKLPVDVMIIDPEISGSPGIEDPLFFAKRYHSSLKRETFPRDISSMRFETAAFQAEQELNTIMYQDTGMYRNRQFKKAIPVPLQLTYEEIAILWKQEAKYRPNFETIDDKVMVPVMFVKISGVKNDKTEYWDDISDLVQEHVFVIKGFPYANAAPNPFMEKSYQFLRDGKLDISRIKSNPSYPFSIIRESMQDYMLEKLQEMIDHKIIKGTGSSGVENLIVATVFHMDTKILRLIQNYDFTKEVPKVLAIHTKECKSSQEDSILLAYLNMIGFDIAIFIPTGYVSVEQYYTKQLLVEHQIGEYQYDMRIPDFNLLKKRKEGIAGRIFRRGR